MQDDYDDLRREVDNLAKEVHELRQELRSNSQVGPVVRMYDRLLEISSDLGKVQQAFSQQQLNVMQTVSALGERVAGNTVTLASMKEDLAELKEWKKAVSGGGTRPPVSARKIEENYQKMAVEALVTSMGPDELVTFMFDQEIPDAEIAGETHRVKCTNLIKWTVRRGKFWETVRALREARPRSLWPIDTGPLDPGVVGA